ncbi:MAG: bacillithiol biosynthesis cysteine-adding enzyme BshC [Chitinophagaceae bacterium]|nr:bacillithiol biosynthesis cysteine-adding enzyme BshC [Chitinophagaceae bacterium]
MTNFISSNLSFKKTTLLPQIVLDFFVGKLKNIQTPIDDLEQVFEKINSKKFPLENRNVLANVLLEQYEEINDQRKNELILQLKDENTFTICTAHQPNIFTGYLYFIYKIIHVIKLAKELNSKKSKFNFIPIFYIGSEDHDVDEIGTFFFDEKKFQWKPKKNGACGEMTLENLQDIKTEIIKMLNPNDANQLEIINNIKLAYSAENTLAKATRLFVNALFENTDLLILDANNTKLKKLFTPIIKDELFNQNSLGLVKKMLEGELKNYKIQAYPREINLFYLKENLRERIVFENEKWKINHTNIEFSALEIEAELENFPERFSPNVILRPLYQETILPNVIQVGGSSEIAYWLQLKEVFDFYNVDFPNLILRQSVLFLNNKSIRKIEKSRLDLYDFFNSIDELLEKKVQDNTDLVSLKNQLNTLEEEYNKIISSLNFISPNLTISLQAQLAKIKKLHNRIELKTKAHLKKNDEDLINDMQRIKKEIFPNGIFQERILNFIALQQQFPDINIIKFLLEKMNISGKELQLISEVKD